MGKENVQVTGELENWVLENSLQEHIHGLPSSTVVSTFIYIHLFPK